MQDKLDTIEYLFKICTRIEYVLDSIHRSVLDKNTITQLMNEKQTFELLFNTWLKDEVKEFNLKLNPVNLQNFYFSRKLNDSNNFGLIFNSFSGMLWNEGYISNVVLDDVIQFTFSSYITERYATSIEIAEIFLKFAEICEYVLLETNQMN